MSSQVMDSLENNAIVKDMEDLSLETSYEAAMEALSSLITTKRRGEKSSVDRKYGKLERMSLYLQVLIYASRTFKGLEI